MVISISQLDGDVVFKAPKSSTFFQDAAGEVDDDERTAIGVHLSHDGVVKVEAAPPLQVHRDHQFRDGVDLLEPIFVKVL